MSSYSLPLPNVLAGNVKREILHDYKKSASAFCKDIALDYARNNHHGNIQHCAGMYNIVFPLFNLSRNQEKQKSWLELKATVEVVATRDVPAHVSTTQWHFWNAVFLDILPSLPVSERAARLLALENHDTTGANSQPWSEIWQTYQYVRDVDGVKMAEWDITFLDLIENYEDFSEKLSSLDLATRKITFQPAFAQEWYSKRGAEAVASAIWKRDTDPSTVSSMYD